MAVSSSRLPLRIYLVGMPGSGKSTLGKRLATRLGYSFVDLDEQIVRAEALDIPGIFSQKGEAYFRKAEREALHQTAELAHVVIATGGGTPCFFDNMDFIKSRGCSIFLDTPLSLICQRIREQKSTRPLFLQQEHDELLLQLTQKWNERQSFYRQADIHLDGQEINEETVYAKLAALY